MKLKTRLILSALALVLMATIPLCLYSLKVISSSMEIWTNERVERALNQNLLHSNDPASKKEAAEALVAYRQLKALSAPIKRGILGFSIVLTGIVIVVALGSAWWFANHETKPLHDLVEATQRFSLGDLLENVSTIASTKAMRRASTRVSEEITLLVDSFNLMVTRLREDQKALAMVERRAAWQDIARAIAHEIKNPLTPIRLSTQRLQEKYREKRPDFEKVFFSSTEMILSEIDRLERLANEFSRFARIPSPDVEEVDIDALIASTLEIYEADVSEGRISFKPDGGLPKISADPEQIKQVCVNLLENALDAIRENGGAVTIRTYRLAGWLGIDVTDTGIGMTEEVRKEVFKPYFTTKTEGSGIGLAIVERIITEHNGKVIVESAHRKGTKFTILLPVNTFYDYSGN